MIRKIIIMVLLVIGSGMAVHAENSIDRVVGFEALGTGIIPSYPPDGCQFDEEGCTVKSSGVIRGTHIGNGTFTSTLTILWTKSFPNGSGGFCAPASGEGKIDSADKSTWNIFQVGIVCEVGPTGKNVPHTFNGTYFITTGEKRFANMEGSGNLVSSDDGVGNVLLNINGIIKKPGPPNAATPESPSGTITDTTPTYTWNAVSNAAWYCLYVNDSTGNKINQQWYTAATAGCGSGKGTCSVTPATVLNEGAGQWYIRTYNSLGLGPWSSPMSFTVSP